MTLTSTTDALEIILDKAITTNQLSFSVFYNEYTSTAVTPSSTYGTTNNTTAVNLISPPLSGRQRQLRWCAINNTDTNDIGVTVRFNDNGSYREVLYVYLRVGDTIQYSEEMGWRVYDNEGSEKVIGMNRLPATMRMPEWFGAANITTALTLTSTTAFCYYLGVADRAYTSMSMQYRVTTTIASTTWAEMAIYKGTPSLQSATPLTRLGHVDTSGVWNSTGTKTTTIPMAANMAIGDNLWVVLSNSAGTATQIRAGLSEVLGSGIYQTAANTRPSTTSSFTGTIDSGSAMPWVAWQGIV
jgi:hypothetical protein